MNKLRLRLDELSVESFDTTAVRAEKGTVYGEQCTCPTACTCPGCPTCDASCESCQDTCVPCDASGGGGTCDRSCLISCWPC